MNGTTYERFLRDQRAEAERILGHCTGSVDSAYWRGVINGINLALDDAGCYQKPVPDSARMAKARAHGA